MCKQIADINYVTNKHRKLLIIQFTWWYPKTSERHNNIKISTVKIRH